MKSKKDMIEQSIMNAYSLDLRKLVVAYVEEGHSQAEAARQFKLHPGTVSKWIKLKKQPEV